MQNEDVLKGIEVNGFKTGDLVVAITAASWLEFSVQCRRPPFGSRVGAMNPTILPVTAIISTVPDMPFEEAYWWNDPQEATQHHLRLS